VCMCVCVCVCVCVCGREGDRPMYEEKKIRVPYKPSSAWGSRTCKVGHNEQR